MVENIEGFGKKVKGKIRRLFMTLFLVSAKIINRITIGKDANEEPTEAESVKDKASAAITAAILLIIFILFIVAAVKLGLTFSSIWHDITTFFYGN